MRAARAFFVILALAVLLGVLFAVPCTAAHPADSVPFSQNSGLTGTPATTAPVNSSTALPDVIWLGISSILAAIFRVAPYFLFEFEQIFPFWAIGLVAGSVIAVYGKSKITGSVSRLKATGFGLLGIVPASLLGIASPICMYGTIPVAAALAQEKVPEGWLAAFMMSSVLLNPQLLLFSFALGPTVALVRLLFCILGGVCAGLIVHVFFRNQRFFDFASFGEDACRDIDPDMRVRLLKNIYRAIIITGPYLLVGILIAAVYTAYVPPEIIINLFGDSSWSGVVLAAVIGVPVYICGGGTIPILKAWLDGGMSVGSATAFMLSGPATKITNLSAIKIVLGARNFIFYLFFVMAFSIASGMVIDTIGVRYLS